ncbi:MAG: phosphatidylserine decarboxylase [Rubripirellula sp.]
MDEIVYHDRYQNKTCVEKVYGDEFLRWTYGTMPGKVALNALVKRAVFSHWYGWRMDRAKSRRKIESFIADYELDQNEFLEDPSTFKNFNEFFFRKLKPTARPIDSDQASIVFPADGRHLCIPDLSKSSGLFVKGESFELSTLLDDPALTEQFAGGSLLLSRLCPVDYHRFHFPFGGQVGKARLINGPLYSVNPIALRQNIEILATNKRCLTKLESPSLGSVLLMEIGATCVGGICQTFSEGGVVNKGDEKGYFRFGGSSTITIFEPGRMQFDQDLLENSAAQQELYARFGDRLGSVLA